MYPMFKQSAILVSLLSLTACSFFESTPERPENPVVRGVNYVGITVSDIDKSSALFAEAFDLKAVQNTPNRSEPLIDNLAGRDGVEFKSRVLRSSNAQLRLMQFSSPSNQAKDTPYVEVKGPGIAHVCVQVDSETMAYDKFLDGGATTVGAPEMVQLSSRNPVHYAYARDHDNTMFEVEHVDIAALNLPEPPKNKYRMRHVALASPDIDRLVDFYSVLLEQKNPRRLGRWFAMSGEKFDMVSGLPGTKLKMAFFQVRNMELEIAQILSHPTETPATPRPIDALGHNMIVFDVSDMSAARQKLIQAGGTVVSEPAPMDGGQIMFGRDPDGTLLGFQTLDASAVLSAQNFKDNGI